MLDTFLQEELQWPEKNTFRTTVFVVTELNSSCLVPPGGVVSVKTSSQCRQGVKIRLIRIHRVSWTARILFQICQGISTEFEAQGQTQRISRHCISESVSWDGTWHQFLLLSRSCPKTKPRWLFEQKNIYIYIRNC